MIAAAKTLLKICKAYLKMCQLENFRKTILSGLIKQKNLIPQKYIL